MPYPPCGKPLNEVTRDIGWCHLCWDGCSCTAAVPCPEGLDHPATDRLCSACRPKGKCPDKQWRIMRDAARELGAALRANPG